MIKCHNSILSHLWIFAEEKTLINNNQNVKSWNENNILSFISYSLTGRMTEKKESKSISFVTETDVADMYVVYKIYLYITTHKNVEW